MASGEADEELLTTSPLPPDSRRFVDDDVDFDVPTRYAVVAVSPGGEEDHSQWVDLQTQSSEAVSIGHILASSIPGSVGLRWKMTGTEPIRGFRVYRSDGGGALALVSGSELLPDNTRLFVDKDVRAWSTYRYIVAAVKPDGEEVRSHEATVTVRTTKYHLSNGNPNPFTTTTSVEYTLPEATHVTLRVYDVRGAFVATIADGVMPAGVHQATWNGRDHAGNRASGGAYFVRLTARDAVLTGKIVLIR
jgi:hypothetical protein